MKWGVSVRVLVAVVVCCLFESGFSQGPPDIYLGCFYDNHERALTDLITCEDGREKCHASCGKEHTYCQSDNMMTVDFCRTLCRNRNLKYYALEAGSQCFCGGSLSDPLQYGSADGTVTNCSTPCTGDANETCGGEFKLQVYQFKEPVVNSSCFQPGFVPNSYISYHLDIVTGVKINFICQPTHKVVGDSELTCQSDGSYSPNMLPSCNYTGILEEADPTTTVETTTAASTTAAKPLMTLSDFLPYIIGGSAALVFLLVICLVAIFVCRGRKRAGNTRQNIRLKPEAAPVTFINAGFHDQGEAGVGMPDILSTTGDTSLPTADNKLYEHRMSTFSEDPIYENGAAAAEANGVKKPAIHASVKEETEPQTPTDTNPPSPIYANSANEGYTKRYSGNTQRYSGNVYATTDRPTPSRGSSSNDPAFVYATESRSRAKKNATGTKDLVGWSRPSSLYQRTSLDEDEESNEDNISIDPNDLSRAVYAQIDKSGRTGSKETLNSELSGNSFFGDSAKTSATRL